MSGFPCRYCKGRLEPRRVNRLQEYQSRWILVEDLPSLVCTQCGEQYYTPQVHDFVVTLLQSQPRPVRTGTLNIYDADQVIIDAPTPVLA
jgi:YgiT-type zinc finger domain-containing protein